jgi:predicted ArsR family transcriptional regulator
MDTEAAALAVLSGEPDISGAELGRRLGLSDRQGRRILKALSAGGRT